MGEVTSARDALVFLSRSIYQKYGAETLPFITEAWYRLGQGVGARRKRDLPACDLTTAASAFWGQFEGTKIKTLEGGVRVSSSSGKCELGLENAGRGLCQAMMHLDKGMLEAVVGSEVNMEILRTVAAGDKSCEIVYSLRAG